jgi:hypothetical protein
MTTQPDTEIPRDLRIVGYITIAFGLLSTFDMIVRLLKGGLHVDFGIVQIPIGLGLLRLQPMSRRLAVVFLSLAFLLLLIFIGFTIVSPQPPDLMLFGDWAGTAPRPFALALSIASGILIAWEFNVLRREDVQRLFRT